jgi:hypothetical protein
VTISLAFREPRFVKAAIEGRTGSAFAALTQAGSDCRQIWVRNLLVEEAAMKRLRVLSLLRLSPIFRPLR